MENLENNIPNVSPFENIKVTTLHRSSLQKPGLLGLFQRFVEFFMPSEGPVKITGKVRCYSDKAKKVQAQLKEIRNELKTEVDDELSPMITEVINSMLSNVNRINRMFMRENGKSEAIKHFQAWTKDAKLWVELCSKNKDKKGIKSAIVKHIISKSMERIERDICYIDAYFRQSIEQLNLDPEETSRISREKANSLSKHVEMLRSLQVLPVSMPFDCVTRWRQDLDDQRAKHFDTALHVIDS